MSPQSNPGPASSLALVGVVSTTGAALRPRGLLRCTPAHLLRYIIDHPSFGVFFAALSWIRMFVWFLIAGHFRCRLAARSEA
ncbi:hypothetical protein K469DRAFT_719629 [Zopfia rhizophila CBS 207.26]|uniref:Uncharacterized protein n=1 Tax=Zopfia rhizophila CBS 207.26 TaxID=1314779 RepID=A0A6A6DH32_9PEZI|nr:hypothetical protein K469DRAFT_719629 [Zopfia rhizophila CBS 207.26]